MFSKFLELPARAGSHSRAVFFADFSFLDKNKTKQKNEFFFSRRICFLLTPSKFETENRIMVFYFEARLFRECFRIDRCRTSDSNLYSGLYYAKRLGKDH